MPLVFISRNKNVISDAIISELMLKLPAIVADALDTSGEDKDGKLTTGDVEVYVRDSKYLDVNTKSLEITIFANHYQARARNLDERRAKIAKAVRAIKSPYFKGFVWVLLVPGSFEEL